MRVIVMGNANSGARKIDLSGQRFGRWTVVCMSSNPTGRSGGWWQCKCDCGTDRTLPANKLRSGRTNSCGCLKIDRKGPWVVTHGQSRTPEWKVWCSMLVRCRNPNSQAYNSYGGRGITVCDEWINSFATFISDMGPRPSAQHSLDRVNNDQGYFRDNCRWATSEQQQNNTRSCRFISYGGITLTIAQWARKLGTSYGLIHDRLRRGWSVERTLNVTHIACPGERAHST